MTNCINGLDDLHDELASLTMTRSNEAASRRAALKTLLAQCHYGTPECKWKWVAK